MPKLGIPLFTANMLQRVVDRDIETPGEDLMTMNEFLWGDDPSSLKLEILNRFDTVEKVNAAFRSCQVRNVFKCCLMLLPRRWASWRRGYGVAYACLNTSRGVLRSGSKHVLAGGVRGV
jgi:hypothetical protein